MNKEVISNETDLVKEIIEAENKIEVKTGRMLDIDTIIKCKLIQELQKLNFILNNISKPNCPARYS